MQITVPYDYCCWVPNQRHVEQVINSLQYFCTTPSSACPSHCPITRDPMVKKYTQGYQEDI